MCCTTNSMLFVSIIYFFIFLLCSADFDETLLFCKSLPPKLTNGLIKRDRVSYYKGQGYIGNMEYSCLPGFNLIGNKVVTCQNGTWSKMVQCRRTEKHCSPIGTYPSNTVIQSKNLMLFQNNSQQIMFGSSIILRCLDNYEFESDAKGSVTIQCQNDGTWTPMPTCRHVQTMCDYSKLYMPSRSTITRMNFKFSEHNRQLHMVGSNLEYTCEDGYRLRDGKTSLIVECLQSGSWSPLPACEFAYKVEPSSRCNYPVYIKNGYLTLYNVTIWEDQTYTGRIVYECNYGYETLHGNDKIASDCINGTWTYVNDCHEIPTCSKQELLDIESQVQDSYVHNVSLQYTRDPLQFVYNSYVLRVCLPNFEHDPLSPPLKITCQRHTNTWTGMPICQSKLVKTTTQMVFTTNDEQTMNSNTDITSAKENIELHTNANQYQTTTENEKNTFSPDITRAIVCNSNEIPVVPNSIIIDVELHNTYNVGARLVFICQSKYESLFDQSSFITCSINGTWSTNTINTTMCQLKKETTADTIIDQSTVLSIITDNSNTTVQIDENLSTMNFTNEDLITSTQSSYATKRQIRETISHCKTMPQIDHALVLSDDTLKHEINYETVYSGSILFICQYGFINNITVDTESFRLTCQNGAFHPKAVCNEKPRCLLPPPINTIRSSIVDSLINVFDTSTNEAIPGSFIVLNCFDKTNGQYTIFNMTCLDNGQWSIPPPLCIAPFKRRCQSAITIPNARTQIFAKLTSDGYYDDGSRATYRCLENFFHDRQSGPLHIQCRNGRWGPRPRCIPSGCLQPMSDTIENGWKSAESYVIQSDIKYYLLTRYSCHDNAIVANTSSHVIDIQCLNSEWESNSLPVCQQQQPQQK